MVKADFSSVIGQSYWAPARKLKHFSDFGSFWCCWLASSNSRKHLVSRFWLLSGAPDVVLQPSRSVPQFRGPWLLVESHSCPVVKRTRSVEDRFLPRLVYPKFRPLQRLNLEVWTSAENQRETDLKRLIAYL